MNIIPRLIECDAQKIKSIQMRWGLHNRPLWQALSQLPPEVSVKWVDRFSAFESIACEWALVMCFERIAQIGVDPRVDYLRAIYAEIQRLGWSFHYLGRLFHAIGDTIRFQYALYLREQILNIQELFTGSRVLPQLFTISGLERDLTLGESRKMKELLTICEAESKNLLGDWQEDQLLLESLSQVLPLELNLVRELKLGGPFAQASGDNTDLRLDQTYGPYKELRLERFQPDLSSQSLKHPQTGDALERTRAVFFQMNQSFRLIAEMIRKLPLGIVKGFSTEEKYHLPGDAKCSVSVEGGSGPITATVEGRDIRISSYTTRLKPAFENLFRGTHIDDLPIAMESTGFELSEADLIE